MKSTREIKLSIIISEDDPDDQYLFKSALLEVNNNVRISNVLTGRQLIESLLKEAVFADGRTEVPDLIIAELKMPFFDLDTVREIRVYNQFSRIPIYLFSLDSSEQLKQKALQAGVTDFYKKPDTFFDLKKIVREIVAKNVS